MESCVLVQLAARVWAGAGVDDLWTFELRSRGNRWVAPLPPLIFGSSRIEMGDADDKPGRFFRKCGRSKWGLQLLRRAWINDRCRSRAG
jgi:hypothetical protein